MALRLAGRGRPPGRVDAGAAPATFVADVAAPAALRRDGWFAHAVRFAAEGEAGSPEVVIPADEALARAAPRRAAAYMAGRYCAARALAAAGRPAAAVPVGEAGAPAWPAGVVGSISHAASRAVAVVADAARWRALGVDCERVLGAAEADEIAGLTLAEADAAAVVGEGALTWPEFVTLGFSAKESLYKCLRPLVGVFFDFADARLTHVDRGAGRLGLRLAADLAPGFARGAAFEAAFCLGDGHAYTVVALDRLPRPAAAPAALPGWLA